MQIFKRILLSLLLLLYFAAVLPVGFAQAADPASESSELTKVPCRVVQQLTGVWGKIIATIVIIFSAFMMLFGKLSLPLGLILIAALGILFGAESVINILSGTTIDCKQILGSG